VTTWRDNVIVIGTFSKCFGMMGWRVGFMLAATRICEQALKVQDAMIICAPVISQIAVEAALRSDWMYTQRFDGEFRLRRQALVDGLAAIPQIRWTPAASGFFAFARVDGCRDSAALSQDLLERAHVVTVPGAAFGRSGEGYLRLSYGAAPLNEISRAVSRIGAITAGDTCKA
jgi:aminotransferase